MTDYGFSTFWANYPRKVAKKDALKAWSQLAPDAELLKRICAALVWQKRQDQWVRDGGIFIPYPATYIRGERWEDVEEVDLSDVVLGKMWWETAPGIEQKGREFGIDPAAYPGFPEFKAAVFQLAKDVPLKRA